MNKRLYITLTAFALLILGAALWQGYEAAQLEGKLARIDQQAQSQRLVQLSLPRVQAKLDSLLKAEEQKLTTRELDPDANSYKMPAGGKASWNRGYFLLTPPGCPTGLMVPAGEEALTRAMQSSPAVMNTLRRKADNPNAPLHDPREASDYRPGENLAVMGVYEVKETDYNKPIQATGKPSDFFSWTDGAHLICMRAIPTTHGKMAEGFLIELAPFAAELQQEIEPALTDAQIRLRYTHEAANLEHLPLLLDPGRSVQLADAPARREALQGTVRAAWLISGGSIALLLILFTLYARMERRRSDFVSAVTHELRTPLTSFKLHTELLKDGQVPAEKQPEYFQRLHRESERLAHLVENVLSYARLTRGKMRGRMDCAPCGELLPPLFDKIKEQLEKADFSFTSTLDTRCHHVQLRTDALTLEQILTNLTDNAIKYAATGSKKAVSLQVIQTHRELQLRFSDSGEGIPENIRKKIFQPFSRSAEATLGRKPGIGLGLALSRDLAHSIGGELRLENSNERGSTFILSLPLGN